jgi:hypothetical protein
VNHYRSTKEILIDTPLHYNTRDNDNLNKDTQYNYTNHNNISITRLSICYECDTVSLSCFIMMSVILMNVIMLNIIMLGVILLNAIMMSAILMNVIVLKVILLSVYA